MPVIRPYRPTDDPGLINVCIRTGAAGEDATDRYADPSVLPAIFALPYAHLEPARAFVVEDPGGTDEPAGVVGYVLGTADTATFARRFREEWLPLVADRYPLADGGRADGGRADGEPPTPDQGMADSLRHPERMVVPALAAWPAHLHIDILPAYQRRGLGRQLIESFVGALSEVGVRAVHLGVATANVKARAFYDRVGFEVLDVPGVPEGSTYLGMKF
ncbi:GNAT family N-acetyltransferase [Luedemannella helvata]|uniref:N-acetyltransferase n=1 Tax=Luedemannella helvata TaxID=349315 RepID=A0ABN2K0N3_9ACTN